MESLKHGHFSYHLSAKYAKCDLRSVFPWYVSFLDNYFDELRQIVRVPLKELQLTYIIDHRRLYETHHSVYTSPAWLNQKELK